MTITVGTQVKFNSSAPFTVEGDKGIVTEIEGTTYVLQMEDGRERYAGAEELDIVSQPSREDEATAKSEFWSFMAEGPSTADLVDFLVSVVSLRSEMRNTAPLEKLIKAEIIRRGDR